MKIALITGGSRGLDKSAALAVAQKGTDVILTYNTKKAEADEVVAEIKKRGRNAVALQLDVSSTKGFNNFVAEVKTALKNEFGQDRFDFLVNNAGAGLHVPFIETNEEQFDQMMNIHIKAPYFLTQKILPLMKDGGRILNLSSGLARFALPGYSAYGTMKGAVETFTRYLAKELGPRKITVNVIAPGPIATDFGGGRVRDNAELNKMMAEQISLGRVGEADDIGLLVASFLAEETRWVNAQRIEASGGIFY